MFAYETLHIFRGFTIDTEEGCMVIKRRHFSDFEANVYKVDDDGNKTMTGTAILTATDIKNRVHEMTGKAYGYVDWT